MRKALGILKIKGHSITEEEELAACIAILMHDIGHRAVFAATLESSLIANIRHEHLSDVYMKKLNVRILVISYKWRLRFLTGDIKKEVFCINWCQSATGC